MPKNTKPALSQKLANADAKALPLVDVLTAWGETSAEADIPLLVSAMNRLGLTAPRGGPITYNVVQRALERLSRKQADKASETPGQSTFVNPLDSMSPDERQKAIEWMERELGLRK